MKKLTIVLGLVLALVSVSSAQKLVAVSPEVCLPMGDMGDVVSAGFGLSARYELPPRGNLSYGANAGFLYFGEKDDAGVTISGVPIEAYANYRIGESGLYAGGFAGFTFWSTSAEFMGHSSSTSNTRLSLGPVVGYRMALNEKMQLDASARYCFGSSSFTYLGLRVGVVYAL